MKQAQQGCVLAYKFKGRRFDCGAAEGYVEATNFCFEHLYKPAQQTRKPKPALESVALEVEASSLA